MTDTTKQVNILPWSFSNRDSQTANQFISVLSSIPSTIHTKSELISTTPYFTSITEQTNQWLNNCTTISNFQSLNRSRSHSDIDDLTSIHESKTIANQEDDSSVESTKESNYEELKKTYQNSLIKIKTLQRELRNIEHRKHDKPGDDVLLRQLDANELALAKISSEYFHLRGRYERLATQLHQRDIEYENLQDSHRLTKYEVMNIKENWFDMRQQHRSNQREKEHYERILFCNEERFQRLSIEVDRLSSVIESKDRCIANLTEECRYYNQQNSDSNTIKQMLIERLTSISNCDIEVRRMVEEDKHGSLLRYDEILSQTHLKEWNNQIVSLQRTVREKQCELNRLIVESDVIRTQRNSLETKVKSLSQDLRRKLKETIPLYRENFNLKSRLEEVTHERNAFRDAMVEIVQAMSPHSDRRFITDNHIQPVAGKEPAALDKLYGWSCIAVDDPIDTLLFSD